MVGRCVPARTVLGLNAGHHVEGTADNYGDERGASAGREAAQRDAHHEAAAIRATDRDFLGRLLPV